MDKNLSRRTVLTGAAWAAPAIALTRAVPAVIGSIDPPTVIAVSWCDFPTPYLMVKWASASDADKPLPAGDYIYTGVGTGVGPASWVFTPSLGSYVTWATTVTGSTVVTLPPGHTVTSITGAWFQRTSTSPLPPGAGVSVSFLEGEGGFVDVYGCIMSAP